MNSDANTMEERWEHFHHGADVGVRGFGPTKAAAFVQAAMALTAVITEPSTVHPRAVVSVACAAPDDELLLVDWLNAALPVCGKSRAANSHACARQFEMKWRGCSNRLESNGTNMNLIVLKIEKSDDFNFILRSTHFIKSVGAVSCCPMTVNLVAARAATLGAKIAKDGERKFEERMILDSILKGHYE